MPLTDAGRNHLAQTLVGEAVTAFNNAGAHIGVGDSAVAFAAVQTDLVAVVNKYRKPQDVGFPTRATNVLTFRSTFGTTEANYAWNEWGVFNALAGGTMFNRKVEALGTKASTQSWQFTVTVTLNNP